MQKMFSIAEVQTKVIFCNSDKKVIFCNSANESCLLQVVHTKAIAALTQFCDFLCTCKQSIAGLSTIGWQKIIVHSYDKKKC